LTSGDVFLIFGGNGLNGSISKENWQFNINERKWEKLNIMFNRTGACSAQASTYPLSEDFWIFGGKIEGKDSKELLKYSLDEGRFSSRSLSPDHVPSEGVACAVNPNDENFILFGGNCKSDVWIFSDNKWTNHSSTVQPIGRNGATAIVYDNSLVVFGGYCDQTDDSSVWRLNLNTLIWTRDDLSPPYPSPRWYHSSFFDNGDHMYIFGGTNSLGNNFGDLWRYNLTSKLWTEIKIQGPSPRENAQIAFDGKNRFFIYGGKSNTDKNPYNDIWQFVLEENCLANECYDCAAKQSRCGWCEKNPPGFQCVAGVSNTPFVNYTCGGKFFTETYYKCPEVGFPSWGISLSIICGIVVIAILVFLIKKIKDSKSPYRSI